MTPIQKYITAREEEFEKKFGDFYVSIDSKTKAIRIVDIENGIKVNGKDGSLIECVASRDIQSFHHQSLLGLLEVVREVIDEKGHQQDDDTIWCNMDELLDIINVKEMK